jgi:hypothetical protein
MPVSIHSSALAEWIPLVKGYCTAIAYILGGFAPIFSLTGRRRFPYGYFVAKM